MAMSNDNKLITNSFMNGSWIFEGDQRGSGFKIKIEIDEQVLVINKWVYEIYEEGIEISSNAHWFGDYLIFSEGKKYYIKHADENTLIFGELIIPSVVGAKVWEYKFIRELK
jgi:hypothetical protein